MGCAESGPQCGRDPCRVESTTDCEEGAEEGAESSEPTDSTRPCASWSLTRCTAAPTSPDRASSSGPGSPDSFQQSHGRRVALGRFAFDDGLPPLGEGSRSVCYAGADEATGERIAVKAYKVGGKAGGRRDVVETFRREVSRLLEIQRPFRRPADRRLWSPVLARVEPSDLFVRMRDFSRDASGAPGPDLVDGCMYLVSELGDRTLRDLLVEHCEQSRPLPEEQVRKITREVTLAVAGLHTKGLVHLDVKPQNVVLCGGRWKLIDMDGCCQVGTMLRRDDAMVSFSLLYCSPEFARFLNEGDSIVASPELDAWSVGVTLAELVELRPVFRATFQQLLRGRTSRQATKMFLHWLGEQSAAPGLSRACSSSFRELLQSSLLVMDRAKRRTLAESLESPFYREAAPQAAALEFCERVKRVDE